MGVIDNFSGLNTNYIPVQRSVPPATPNCVGIISQSGGIGLEILEMFSADNQNFGKWVSIGNAASVGVPEIMAHMGHDPNIKIIAIYLEGVSEYVHRCRAFMAAKKLHTYTVPMIKPLSIALRIWEKYEYSFVSSPA